MISVNALPERLVPQRKPEPSPLRPRSESKVSADTLLTSAHKAKLAAPQPRQQAQRETDPHRQPPNSSDAEMRVLTSEKPPKAGGRTSRNGLPDVQREPPHSVEAEQGVLGSMLQPHGGSEAIAEATAKIGAEHFYVPAHRTIFIAICDLWDAGQAVDLITFTQSLRDKKLLDAVGGISYVTDL
jgi:hypothetical protein